MTKTFTTSKGEFLLSKLNWKDLIIEAAYQQKQIEPIGKVSSLTEEQCKEVVDKHEIVKDAYKDYLDEDMFYETASASFTKLLESLGLEQTDLWLFKIIEK